MGTKAKMYCPYCGEQVYINTVTRGTRKQGACRHCKAKGPIKISVGAAREAFGVPF